MEKQMISKKDKQTLTEISGLLRGQVILALDTLHHKVILKSDKLKDLCDDFGLALGKFYEGVCEAAGLEREVDDGQLEIDFELTGAGPGSPEELN